MHTEDRRTQRKRKILAGLLTAATLLAAMGGIGIYQLGKEDPNDAATRNLAWGDRLEKRLDALIDGSRPKWADQTEAKLDATTDRIGWK